MIQFPWRMLLVIVFCFSIICGINIAYLIEKIKIKKYSSFLEYWPQKAIVAIDYIIDRDNKVKLLSGNADIQNETKENGILNFDISNVSENTFLELPYLFYKGYAVTYTPTGSNEKVKLNNLVESDKGLASISLDTSVSGHINIAYHATTLHKICITISFSTIIVYVICLVISKFKKEEEIKGEQKLLDKG